MAVRASDHDVDPVQRQQLSGVLRRPDHRRDAETSPVKNAAICLDTWKLPIFKKHLDAAGYKYDPPLPFTEGTLLLKVHYEWIHQLKPIVEAAQCECECAETKAKP